MKKIIGILAALILNMQPALGAEQLTNQSNEIHWQAYSSSIFEHAKTTHRPVLLFAKSASCHWCEQFQSTTLNNPTVIKLANKSYTPVVIEINKDRDIFLQYKILKLPTTIIFDVNGNIVKIATGNIKPQRLIQLLEQRGHA